MHFWDEAARRLTAKGTAAKPNPTRAFGFITTNSITQTFSRRVIERRPRGEAPFSLTFAVADHPWLKSADKAAVRIAMTVARAGVAEGVLGRVRSETGLDTDAPVVRLERSRGKITSKLTIGADFSTTKPLWANTDIAHQGFKPYGMAFWISEAEVFEMSKDNPVCAKRYFRPYLNGRDLNQQSRSRYVIDFHEKSSDWVMENFPKAYAHLLERSKPERDHDKMKYRRINWWRFGQPSTEMRQALIGLDRYIATTETAKHRMFVFLNIESTPDQKLRVVASEDSTIFSVLSSRIHICFAIRRGGWQGVGNDPVYQHTSTFDPFPFPDPPAAADLAELGERLDAFRKDRIAAHPHLTMTGLYNALERLRELEAGAPVEPLSEAERDTHEAGRIGILKDLHDRIDRAAFEAYGWGDLAPALVGRPGGTAPSPHKAADQEAAEEALLIRLVALNKARAAEEARGEIRWLRPSFQIPKLRGKAPRPERAEQIEADMGPAAASAARLPWPGDGLDQIRALRAALAQAEAPIGASELNARFKGGRNRGGRLSELLSYMAETGMIRQDAREGPKRYFVAP